MKIKAKIVSFFEDDFLVLLRKDARIDFQKRIVQISKVLFSFGFKLNISKLQY